MIFCKVVEFLLLHKFCKTDKVLFLWIRTVQKIRSVNDWSSWLQLVKRWHPDTKKPLAPEIIIKRSVKPDKWHLSSAYPRETLPGISFILPNRVSTSHDTSLRQFVSYCTHRTYCSRDKFRLSKKSTIVSFRGERVITISLSLTLRSISVRCRLGKRMSLNS